MRIQYFSDVHLEFEYTARGDIHIPEAVAPICVVAGDLATSHHVNHSKFFLSKLADKFEHVVFVLGNHDFYHADIDSAIDFYRGFASKIDNLHFLENETTSIDGVKFAGCVLWTDFKYTNQYYQSEVRLNDFYSLSDGMCIFESNRKIIQPESILKRHKESVNFLADNITPNTVVVTHHGMTYKGMHPKWDAVRPGQRTINHLFYSDLEWLLQEMKPKLVISGHTHDAYDVNVESTRVVCNPRGYVSAYGSENSEFVYETVVEI